MAKASKRILAGDKTLLLVGLLILIAIIFYFQQPPGKPATNPTIGANVQECLPAIEVKYGKDTVEIEKVQLDVNDPALDELGRYDFPKRTFAYLPAYPDDLPATLSLFKQGKLPLNNINPQYWKQPEWYPGFEEKGVPLMKFYPTDAHAAFGYGTYPSEYIITTGPDANFEVFFLLRTDWGVINYQGLKLVPNYPARAQMLRNSFTDGTSDVKQDPAYVRCNLQITEINPGQVALEPAYPFFSPGWAKRIEIKVRTGKNLKPGKYAVGLDVTQPDAAFNDEMTQKFGPRFVTGGGFGTGQPWLTMYLDVK